MQWLMMNDGRVGKIKTAGKIWQRFWLCGILIRYNHSLKTMRQAKGQQFWASIIKWCLASFGGMIARERWWLEDVLTACMWWLGGSNNVCVAALHILHAGTLAENDNDYLSRISVAAAQKWAGYLAAAVLGTPNPRRAGFERPYWWYSYQSGETRLCIPCGGLAVFIVSPVCAARFVARRLGGRGRNRR